MLLMDICQSGALIICQGKAAARKLLQCSAATQQHRAVLHPELPPDNKVSLSFSSITKDNCTLEIINDLCASLFYAN